VELSVFNNNEQMSVQDAKQILFQDSLADVVRQMRNSRKGEAETIQEALADIRSELKSTAQHVKVTAVVKLTYFAMLGYAGDYGAFNIIEVMADSHFQHKRAGYVAAAVILNDSSPVLPLCTALLKKDMMSPNQYEVGLALYCLSSVCTPDLARDLVSDVVGLLNSPRAGIRKKAVLCLYKIFLQFPEALRPTYPMLKEKLEDGSDKADSDPAVRGAVVNVLCELARRNPGNFLNLVPPFYNLLSSIHNNWTLIKVIKVFGYFAPLEPRLGKKLVDPLTNIITTTHAKSVQYECILAVANGMNKVASLTKIAVDRMKVFAEDRDANLKYLGLDAMSRIMREAPKQLADQRDTVLRCLADRDPTIRDKALLILQGMVTKKNLVSTVNSMFDNVNLIPVDEEWSNRVIKTIIDTIKEDDYANVQDFEWYLAVLMDIAQLPLQSFKHGELIEAEFVDIVTRVNAVRQFGVESMASLLCSSAMLSANTSQSTQWMIVRAAAFICGEYPYWLTNKKTTVEHLLADRVLQMPPSLQAVAVTAVSKILAFAVRPCDRHMARRDGEEELQDPDDTSTLTDVITTVIGDAAAQVTTMQVAPLSRVGANSRESTLNFTGPIAKFCASVDPVVQERSLLLHFMATQVKAKQQHSADGAAEANAPFQQQFFAAEIEPVAEGAQEAVAVPADVDFDTPFCETLPALVDSDGEEASDSDDSGSERGSMSVEAALRQEKERQVRRRADVDTYYLKAGEDAGAGDDLPPVEPLEGLGKSVPSRHRASGKKSHTINKQLSRPAGFVLPTSKKATNEEPVDEAAMKLRHISVDRPVGKDEVLPTIQPYKRIEASASPQRGGPAGSKGDAGGAAEAENAALETMRIGASRNFNPVEAITCESATVTLQVVETKPKKDGGYTIHLLAALKNRLAGHSLYAPKIRLAEGSTTEFFRLQNAEGTAVDSIAFAEKVKSEGSVNAEFSLVLMGGIPDLSQPIAFELVTTEKKKDHVFAGAMPLLCKYFLQLPEKMSRADFEEKVLGSLVSAGCVAAGIPVGANDDLGAAIDHIRTALRLSVVDTFRDCVVLHGVLVQRKKTEPTYVALIAKEECEGDDRQLVLYVKCASDSLTSGIVSEASVAMGGEVEA
jgi:AP-3 complex subunit delta-1